MRRAEIARKFDEIVAFSEIERFLDTPVKHYSSGMYVRLAFAIAAHLEPEILIVDEVLAVGDAQFQKKCLNKVSEVTHSDGRTVLFVSHNSAALQSICSVGIWLSQGRIAGQGPIGECLAAYLRTGQQAGRLSRPGGGQAPHHLGARRPAGLAEGRIQVEVGFRVALPPLAAGRRDHRLLEIRLPDRRQQRADGRRVLAAEAGARRRGDGVPRPRPPLHSDSYLISAYLGDAGIGLRPEARRRRVRLRLTPLPPPDAAAPGDRAGRFRLALVPARRMTARRGAAWGRDRAGARHALGP